MNKIKEDFIVFLSNKSQWDKLKEIGYHMTLRYYGAYWYRPNNGTYASSSPNNQKIPDVFLGKEALEYEYVIRRFYEKDEFLMLN